MTGLTFSSAEELRCQLMDESVLKEAVRQLAAVALGDLDVTCRGAKNGNASDTVRCFLVLIEAAEALTEVRERERTLAEIIDHVAYMSFEGLPCEG